MAASSPASPPVSLPQPSYSERLLPGPLGWAMVALFALLMGIALYPVDVGVAVVVATALLVAGVAAGVLTTPRVAVVAGELQAGQAHIPVALLGTVRTLDPAETRHELGPALDARAYLCLRAWAKTAVKVEVIDPVDSTPYWIVSTRHPRELALAITQARERPAGPGY